MTGMRFLDFTEINDHEGETWRFWLQVDGNEEALEKLRGLIVTADIGDEYTLATEPVDESTVDSLVKYGRSGYRPFETKVTGVFTCPDDLGEWGDDLYKGRITGMFMSGESS